MITVSLFRQSLQSLPILVGDGLDRPLLLLQQPLGLLQRCPHHPLHRLLHQQTQESRHKQTPMDGPHHQDSPYLHLALLRLRHPRQVRSRRRVDHLHKDLLHPPPLDPPRTPSHHTQYLYSLVVNPIGFLHGFVMLFPDFQPLNYIYAIALVVFHFGIYQPPFKDLKYYWLTRASISGIWVFAIYVLIGNCSNFLPLEPDL